MRENFKNSIKQYSINEVLEEEIVVPKIKSPLRYPGGKSKALKDILPIITKYVKFKEFREPFVGGGSVFVAVKQLYPKKKYWINDLNKDLYCFWEKCRDQPDDLIKEIQRARSELSKEGLKFYEGLIYLRNECGDEFSHMERAVWFFLLNRITFSGLADSGGYSELAFKGRLTQSSLERVRELGKVLSKTKITNSDYSDCIFAPGRDVFIFLDPPYYSTTKSKLYGKKGDLHLGFDHKKFSENMKKCKHKWLITYDDCPEIEKLFEFAHVYRWSLQYGMNNYKQDKAKKGKEFFISNFPIPSLEKNNKPLNKKITDF